MLNKTNINKEVVSKILGACREALTADGGCAYIDNKQGKPFLRVKRITMRRGGIGFEVLDKSNKNIAELITRTLVIGRKSQEMCGKSKGLDLNDFILKRLAFTYQIA